MVGEWSECGEVAIGQGLPIKGRATSIHSKSTSCLGIRRSVEGLGNRCKKFVGQAAKDRTT